MPGEDVDVRADPVITIVLAYGERLAREGSDCPPGAALERCRDGLGRAAEDREVERLTERVHSTAVQGPVRGDVVDVACGLVPVRNGRRRARIDADDEPVAGGCAAPRAGRDVDDPVAVRRGERGRRSREGVGLDPRVVGRRQAPDGEVDADRAAVAREVGKVAGERVRPVSEEVRVGNARARNDRGGGRRAVDRGVRDPGDVLACDEGEKTGGGEDLSVGGNRGGDRRCRVVDRDRPER